MNDAQPTVSVVVPCRNERKHIEACVSSILAQQSPPGGFEVIVADGMSDDGTREILQGLARRDPRLRVEDNPGRTTPRAMNAGIRADNVGGAMICEADTWLQRAIAAAHHSPFSVGGARWHNPNYEGPSDTVFGGVYRREVFTRIGLFDEELTRNQDDELNLRLTRAGGKIWQSPAIQSWYRPRASLGALFRQYMQYGYWKVRVIQKHKIPASVRHLVPAGFVLLLIVLPLVALGWRPSGWAWLGLLATYLVCNLGASVLTAAGHGWKLFPVLPAVFVCYHIGYGYGFLLGIWDFLVVRRAPATSFTKLTRTS